MENLEIKTVNWLSFLIILRRKCVFFLHIIVSMTVTTEHGESQELAASVEIAYFNWNA